VALLLVLGRQYAAGGHTKSVVASSDAVRPSELSAERVSEKKRGVVRRLVW